MQWQLLTGGDNNIIVMNVSIEKVGRHCMVAYYGLCS